MNNTTSVGEMFERTDELISWLIELGVTTANFSRVSEYRGLAKAFFAAKDPTSPDALKLFMQLTDAIYEFIGLLHVKDTFKNEVSIGFLERLENAHKGKAFCDNAQDGASRNFLFELLIASFFSEKGYAITFNSDTDVLATKDGIKIYVECKKCYSVNKIEKNLKKAHRQLLVNGTKNDTSVIGLVAIDISNITSEHIPKSEFINLIEAEVVIGNAVSRTINSMSRQIDEFNASHIHTTLATIVYSSHMFWLSNVSTFLHKSYRVKAATLLGDAEFTKLEKLLT